MNQENPPSRLRTLFTLYYCSVTELIYLIIYITFAAYFAKRVLNLIELNKHKK